MNEFLSGPLNETHRLEEFDCGQESLNGWLQTQAGRAQAAGTARTYVWTPTGQARVMAYYCLAPTQALAFYLRHDFIPIAGSHRLYLKIATARLALEKNPLR